MGATLGPAVFASTSTGTRATGPVGWGRRTGNSVELRQSRVKSRLFSTLNPPCGHPRHARVLYLPPAPVGTAPEPNETGLGGRAGQRGCAREAGSWDTLFFASKSLLQRARARQQMSPTIFSAGQPVPATFGEGSSSAGPVAGEVESLQPSRRSKEAQMECTDGVKLYR